MVNWRFFLAHILHIMSAPVEITGKDGTTYSYSTERRGCSAALEVYAPVITLDKRWVQRPTGM